MVFARLLSNQHGDWTWCSHALVVLVCRLDVVYRPPVAHPAPERRTQHGTSRFRAAHHEDERWHAKRAASGSLSGQPGRAGDSMAGAPCAPHCAWNPPLRRVRLPRARLTRERSLIGWLGGHTPVGHGARNAVAHRGYIDTSHDADVRQACSCERRGRCTLGIQSARDAIPSVPSGEERRHEAEH
jgi:hypothetical protein